MFVSWMALWVAFGVLGGRGLCVAPLLAGVSSARGLVAALASGLAFYAVSGIWTRFDPRTIDYPYHLLCWTIAFLPGFLALLLERKPRLVAGRTSFAKTRLHAIEPVACLTGNGSLP